MKSALITGITGQDGSYLAELLLAKDYRVFGLSRGLPSTHSNVEHLKGRIEILHGDMLDHKNLIALLERTKPDEVYNLAAPGYVVSSWDTPIQTAESAALGVACLLESIRTIVPSARFYQASSSEIFGNAPEEPQTENTPFRPRSPYGAAKLYAHWMTVNCRDHYGLHATSGILYNHESPRRGLAFVTRKITREAARIKKGLSSELRLGNLDGRRDWGFAGDYVYAMWLMLQQDKAEDYVISTGCTHTVREFAELAFARLDLDYREFVKVDEQFFRPAERISLVGNPSKAQKVLGWQPEVDFENLVYKMVDAEQI